MSHFLCVKSISCDGKFIAEEPTQHGLSPSGLEAPYKPGSRQLCSFHCEDPNLKGAKGGALWAVERSESSPEDVAEGGQFWSVLSSEGGAGSQEEHVKRAEVGSETISLALPESKNAPGGISSLPWLSLDFWEIFPSPPARGGSWSVEAGLSPAVPGSDACVAWCCGISVGKVGTLAVLSFVEALE